MLIQWRIRQNGHTAQSQPQLHAGTEVESGVAGFQRVMEAGEAEQLPAQRRVVLTAVQQRLKLLTVFLGGIVGLRRVRIALFLRHQTEEKVNGAVN